MSFYGNITNTSRTQFQFDRTYSSRRQMDTAATTDGVYIGRYVLVEYDKQLAADWCTTAFQKTENGKLNFYSSNQLSAVTMLFYGVGNITAGKYIRIPGTYTDINGKQIVHNLDDSSTLVDILYEIIGGSGNNITVKKVSEFKDSPYNENYNIDLLVYGAGRGYDSTVWQKVYTEQNEKYVMVAELNSVVPTFGVSPDAPTMSPVIPHFDADSTNVYYKVHWQPSWGLRVKSALNSIQAYPLDDSGATIPGNKYVTLSTTKEDSTIYSDETTVWTKSGYNPTTNTTSDYVFVQNLSQDDGRKVVGEWVKSAGVKNDDTAIPANIYYNKAGFSSDVITYSPSAITDKIAVEPTGLSGHTYNTHNKTGGREAQVDTQELSILLPSLGDNMAKIWNLVYGDESLNGGNERNLDIAWRDGSIGPNGGGLRLYYTQENGYGYVPEAGQTIAGAINSVHDLMGMIIRKQNDSDDPTKIDITTLNKDYIYYFPKTGKFYRKRPGYKLTGTGVTGTFNPEQKGVWTLVTGLSKWPDKNTTYYWKDQVAGAKYPNYILEQPYDSGKTYYKVTAPDDSKKVKFGGGKFKPYVFFEYENLNVDGIPTHKYKTSMDTTYTASKSYYKITSKMLGDNIRIFREGLYFKATFTQEKNPTKAGYDSDAYFVLRDGHYYRATEEFDPNTAYYIPSFESVAGGVNDSDQYYMISKQEDNGYIFIEKVTYTKAVGVTAANFNQRTYYTESNGLYTEALEFKANTTYYTKSVKYEAASADTKISPANALEVKLVNWASGIYYQYTGVNKDGYPEYTYIENALIGSLMSNICTIVPEKVTDFYAAGVYYYQVGYDTPNTPQQQENPLYGSWVIDMNERETEGRQYYTNINGATQQSIKAYEKNKYYLRSANGHYTLSTGDFVNGTDYYTKTSYFVESDTTNQFPVGMEWNINVETIPAGVTLKQRTEVWELQEIEGFARHLNTIHGLILKINEMLEYNDELTRRSTNVQGVINQVKDVIAQFGELRASEHTITDQYGRITTVPPSVDSWLGVAVEPANNRVRYWHKYLGDSTGKGDHTVGVQEPNFGATFNIPTFTTDNMGHVTKTGTVTTKIPLPSLTNTGNSAGNVIVSMALVPETGAFSYTKNYIANLALTQYTTGTYTDTTDMVAATDTLKAAIAKIEYKLGSRPVNTRIAEAIDALDVDSVGQNGYYLKTISETNGKITATTQAFDTSISDTASSNSSVNAPTTKAVYDMIAKMALTTKGSAATYLTSITENLGRVTVTTENKVTTADSLVNSDSSNLLPTCGAVAAHVTNRINGLDKNQIGADGSYIKYVSETDGIVSASMQAFDASISTTKASTSEINAPTSRAVFNFINDNMTLAAAVGNSNSYITSINQSLGKVSATSEAKATSVTENDTKLITSGAVYSALSALTVDNSSTGNYVQKVTQSNGKIAVTMGTVATSIASDSSTTIPVAPKTVYDHVTSRLSAFTGNSNIATVGTITTGTWNATAIVGSKVVLTGYSKGSSTAAIAASDSINGAIAKLENRIANLESKVV